MLGMAKKKACDLWYSYGLLDVVDIVAKGAAGCLQSILDMRERVQNAQRELSVPVSKLYHISTLYADNASVNPGPLNGLTPFLNEARNMAWEHDLQEKLVQGGSRGTFPKFKDLQFKGCDDHITALVYSAFNGVLLDRAKERYPSFSHAKKRGGFVSLPFHLLEHIPKCLLGFLASAWRGGREEHKRTHGRVELQGHTLNVVKCHSGIPNPSPRTEGSCLPLYAKPFPCVPKALNLEHNRRGRHTKNHEPVGGNGLPVFANGF